MTPNKEHLPHWDVSNIFPSLESEEFAQAMEDLKTLIDDFEKYIMEQKISKSNVPPPDSDTTQLSEVVATLIEQSNAIYHLAFSLRAYIYSFVTTDSYNTEAARRWSQIQAQIVRAETTRSVIQGWIGVLSDRLEEITDSHPTNQAHAFFLIETNEQAKYLMSDVEESLAAELSLTSLRAWNKLHGTITSQLKVNFDLDGEVQSLPMPALQNVRRFNPDEAVRQRAFEAEIEVWEENREPLAACMNSVKGYVNTLDKRRGREDALHSSIDLARIDRPTLEVMLGEMQAAFPDFRRYLKAKAVRLGKESLAWWDIFAPVGQNEQVFTWDETRRFIVEVFATFSKDLSSFAEYAIEHHWIDAEPRDGKRGGAFCMSIWNVEESRILCNFDGSFDQLSTVAHELGHAYHNKCLAGKTPLQRRTPMTMAETASIMCETIITNAALQNSDDDNEKLAILETSLIGVTQVIVDIYSRYLFEKEVFERREQAELSADDFCEIMTRAQKATYGEGLNEAHLHPYMWAWKPHYYRTDLSFYNYPYAFGLLFGTGLYAIYQQRGEEFIPEYVELLGSTGLGTATDLAKRFDIDLRSPAFWKASLDIIRAHIDDYIAL
jgi:pepF/M3 family oligoendopeptidase